MKLEFMLLIAVILNTLIVGIVDKIKKIIQNHP